jgi:hypothetical protein
VRYYSLNSIGKSGAVKMATSSLERGMAWVSNRLSDLLLEREIPFSDVSWPEMREDTVHRVHTLIFRVPDNEYTEKFTEENISALPGDKKIRGRVEERLKTVVDKIVALAWIIHEVCSQKRKDALKGMMNTGFRHPAFPFGASIA